MVRLLNQSPPACDDPELWSSIESIGAQITAAVREALREQANRAPEGTTGGKRPRVNRAAAEQQIMEHLTRRPHDTAAAVAGAIGCSVGVVAESPAWKANQARLRAARELQAKSGRHVDPIALDLRDFLNRAGGSASSQLHAHRRAQEAADDAIDQRDRELYRLIAQFEQQHPNATPQQVAKALGCTAGDVERRRSRLSRLVDEQTSSDREDNPTVHKPQKHYKRV